MKSVDRKVGSTFVDTRKSTNELNGKAFLRGSLLEQPLRVPHTRFSETSTEMSAIPPKSKIDLYRIKTELNQVLSKKNMARLLISAKNSTTHPAALYRYIKEELGIENQGIELIGGQLKEGEKILGARTLIGKKSLVSREVAALLNYLFPDQDVIFHPYTVISLEKLSKQFLLSDAPGRENWSGNPSFIYSIGMSSHDEALLKTIIKKNELSKESAEIFTQIISMPIGVGNFNSFASSSVFNEAKYKEGSKEMSHKGLLSFFVECINEDKIKEADTDGKKEIVPMEKVIEHLAVKSKDRDEPLRHSEILDYLNLSQLSYIEVGNSLRDMLDGKITGDHFDEEIVNLNKILFSALSARQALVSDLKNNNGGEYGIMKKFIEFKLSYLPAYQDKFKETSLNVTERQFFEEESKNFSVAIKKSIAEFFIEKLTAPIGFVAHNSSALNEHEKFKVINPERFIYNLQTAVISWVEEHYPGLSSVFLEPESKEAHLS